MKSCDHVLLAKHLLYQAQKYGVFPSRRFCFFFLLGNQLPDCNPLTYLRGIKESKKMHGHNFPYSAKIQKKIVIRLQKNRQKTCLDAYALGTLLHYLADCFTFVHTPLFHGSIPQHNAYESALHYFFFKELLFSEKHPPRCVQMQDFSSFLFLQESLYLQNVPSFSQDAKQISFVCQSAFFTLLPQFFPYQKIRKNDKMSKIEENSFLCRKLKI